MNCSFCQYRVPIIGHETPWARPSSRTTTTSRDCTNMSIA